MDDGIGYALFDTPIGRCAVAWSGRGMRALQLPEASDAATLGRLRRGLPPCAEREPPPPIAQAVAEVVALLHGEPRELSGIALDFEGVPPFECRVYALARAIPPGRTSTYGELAERLGEPGAARAVGQALGRNPFAIVVPCHRVVAAGGALGGFSANGGAATKRRLLQIEAVHAAALPLFAASGERRAADSR